MDISERLSIDINYRIQQVLVFLAYNEHKIWRIRFIIYENLNDKRYPAKALLVSKGTRQEEKKKKRKYGRADRRRIYLTSFGI
jgi:hypothetical protein